MDKNFEKAKCRQFCLKPCASDRVCSEHFLDQIPNVDNPDPTINLDYEIYVVFVFFFYLF